MNEYHRLRLIEACDKVAEAGAGEEQDKALQSVLAEATIIILTKQERTA